MTSWNEADARAATFLAITPPDEVCDALASLQRCCGLAADMAPHITVKAQPGLNEPERWLPAVTAGLTGHRPFEVTLGLPRWFGAGIVYLSVAGDAVPVLHRLILSCLNDAGIEECFEYEGAGYVPHLTLGALFAGARPEQLRLLAEKAATLSFPRFSVDRIWAFHRADEDSAYTPWHQLRIGG
ncbi:MAG: 2'-5' RNA ligase family protein [Mycobacterium sp.]|nr:2'-5' RNA ligase family protein [Mycobacterium sp.]